MPRKRDVPKTREKFGIIYCDYCHKRIKMYTDKNCKSHSIDRRLHFCIKDDCKNKYYAELRQKEKEEEKQKQKMSDMHAWIVIQDAVDKQRKKDGL
jgi:hypothetical protein